MITRLSTSHEHTDRYNALCHDLVQCMITRASTPHDHIYWYDTLSHDLVQYMITQASTMYDHTSRPIQCIFTRLPRVLNKSDGQCHKVTTMLH